jgi:hypothetical protein
MTAAAVVCMHMPLQAYAVMRPACCTEVDVGALHTAAFAIVSVHMASNHGSSSNTVHCNCHQAAAGTVTVIISSKQQQPTAALSKVHC